MTTATLHTTKRPPLWLFCVLAAALVIPPVVSSTHILDNPHAEAAQIRQCARDPLNLLQIWLNHSGERLNCLIDLGGGKVGDYVLQPCKRGVLEVTAYIIGAGSLREAVEVLIAKGCARVYP
jgi:hypothetical protein